MWYEVDDIRCVGWYVVCHGMVFDVCGGVYSGNLVPACLWLYRVCGLSVVFPSAIAHCHVHFTSHSPCPPNLPARRTCPPPLQMLSVPPYPACPSNREN